MGHLVRGFVLVTGLGLFGLTMFGPREATGANPPACVSPIEQKSKALADKVVTWRQSYEKSKAGSAMPSSQRSTTRLARPAAQPRAWVPAR